jgi:uncharacterized membrane protein YqgA involved in biofilm formation
VIKLYTGVIINTLFVILGGLIGIFLKNYIKEKYTKTIMDSIGVFVLILGISYALESNNLIYVLISVILGGLIGEFLKIGDLLDKLRNKFQKDPNSSISPIDGINPEDLNIASLINDRLDNVKEIILAINPSIEGEVTSLYIQKILEKKDIKISRLSYGIPMGGDIEYLDPPMISKALDDRKVIS